MTQPRLDRQRSAPLFLPTPSIKPTTPLTAFSQHFATISGQENPTSDGQPDLAKKGFRVQRSHRRVEPVFENGARVRCFEVMPSDRVHLFHGLPFQKYNQSLVSEFEFQRMIVVNELKLLLDKGKSLKAKFNDTPDLALFDLVDEKIQQGFNAIFEETVGLVFIVTEILMACEQSVRTESEAFFENIHLFVQEVERLGTAQELYIRRTKRKRTHPPSNTLDPATMNLLMQFLARARFNVGEVHEEFAVQEAHQSQQTKWLCRMASMTSLQDFVPGEIKQILRGEQVVDEKQTLTKEQVKDRIKTGYRKGSLARNLGLAVLHERKDHVPKPKNMQTNQDFIQKLLGKFSTTPRTLHRQPSSDFVQIENYKSQATQAREDSEKHFSMRPSALPFGSRPASLPASQRPVNNKGDKEVIRALHIGLLVSSDEKRFSTIRSIILEHEQIWRAKNERLRKGAL